MMKVSRRWATPLTMGAFLLIGVTGVAMFFHASTGLGKTLHEWLGWLLIAGVGLHVAANWRAFLQHWKSPVGIGFVGVFTVLVALALIPFGSDAGGRRPGGADRTAVAALVDAPLSEVAPLTDRSVEDVVKALREAGFSDADPTRSLGDLIGEDREARDTAFQAVFSEVEG